MVVWSAQHAANLSKLLATTPLVEELESNHLPSLDGNGLEERAMAASERHGAEEIIQAIINLAQVEDKPLPKSPYIADLEHFEEPAPPLENV